MAKTALKIRAVAAARAQLPAPPQPSPGPVKAALESVVRYMAAELGEKGIRVHAVSPGPMKTRAASGIQDSDKLLEEAASKAPLHHLVMMEHVGAVAAFLVSDAAHCLTGNVTYADAGYHILG